LRRAIARDRQVAAKWPSKAPIIAFRRGLAFRLPPANTKIHRHGACGLGTIGRGPCRPCGGDGQTRALGLGSAPQSVAMMADALVFCRPCVFFLRRNMAGLKRGAGAEAPNRASISKGVARNFEAVFDVTAPSGIDPRRARRMVSARRPEQRRCLSPALSVALLAPGACAGPSRIGDFYQACHARAPRAYRGYRSMRLFAAISRSNKKLRGARWARPRRGRKAARDCAQPVGHAAGRHQANADPPRQHPARREPVVDEFIRCQQVPFRACPVRRPLDPCATPCGQRRVAQEGRVACRISAAFAVIGVAKVLWPTTQARHIG